ncbi:bifunctional DNA primase/polymerase [Actinosynnema sp. NPDC047251]|uniref:DNA primase/polymerase bifunctional N-terminal domain-containing protein n=1 Tax=Saccharothrix espanaensis (strain ATCC 51144 / DSM 44229 / JCM 9112 / NBRC 15066 / NRRL 15764) TaxID=1179773 RepID=K0KA69_SACES|nr:bifunctional DNA primase/polymerase [Saccharothrix espanaensis]CCH35216.1 hypothetical protein BN6_79980 [Saccharothrix espanaensis DSM 44229]
MTENMLTDDTLPTVAQAAVSYAKLGWPVLPSAVWHDGAFVHPVTGEPVDDVPLRPREEATTDVALVHQWWNAGGDFSPAILGVTGPAFGVVSVSADRTEQIMVHRWFTTRPTPVLVMPGMPIALFVVRPPFPAGFGQDEIRRFSDGSLVPLPPTTAGETTATWLVSPWETEGKLLVAREFAELLNNLEKAGA